MLHTLNEPFKIILNLSNAQSTLLQASFYLAYFIFSIPAAILAARKGYKVGLLLGLLLCVLGALLVLPATNSISFNYFLLAMFILASGIAVIETNANPYITKLGDPKKESFRLNLAQTFNGVGSVLGPLLAGLAIPSAILVVDEVMPAIGKVYLFLSLIFGLLFTLLLIIKLPDVTSSAITQNAATQNAATQTVSSPRSLDLIATFKSIWHLKSYRLGVMALIIFIGAQVSGMALFSSFALEQIPSLQAAAAVDYLAILLTLFVLGRGLGTILIAKFAAQRILTLFMLLAAAAMMLAGIGLGEISVYAAMAAYLFISIGFPTIFSLSIRELNEVQTKLGASILMMCNVGSALMPLMLGAFADLTALKWSFTILAGCFAIVATYGLSIKETK